MCVCFCTFVLPHSPRTSTSFQRINALFIVAFALSLRFIWCNEISAFALRAGSRVNFIFVTIIKMRCECGVALRWLRFTDGLSAVHKFCLAFLSLYFSSLNLLLFYFHVVSAALNLRYCTKRKVFLD